MAAHFADVEQAGGRRAKGPQDGWVPSARPKEAEGKSGRFTGEMLQKAGKPGKGAISLEMREVSG